MHDRLSFLRQCVDVDRGGDSGSQVLSGTSEKWRCCFLILAMIFACFPIVQAGPVRAEQQVEEDWMQQVSLRMVGLAGERQTRPELDAIGACDGVINGEYGFHTLLEEKPWWQIDLGENLQLDRLVVYNRCGGFETRASRMCVLVSADGRQFDEVYRHDGSVFCGQSDGKPLTIKLKGVKARHVRLQLPGRDYFHLDEVQVYASGCDKNLALHRRATQSSVSQWSTAKGGHSDWSPVLRATLEGGFRLAAALANMGVSVEAERKTLASIKTMPEPDADGIWRERYLQARRVIRTMALANPLLDFDSIVFAKRAPTLFPHLSDQNYGWWSRPGGGVFILKNFKGGAPELAKLSGDFAPGNFLQPELSHDANRLLFAYCKHFPEVQHVKDKYTKSNLPEESFASSKIGRAHV